MYLLSMRATRACMALYKRAFNFERSLLLNDLRTLF